jgi:hypothetical protein
MIDKWLKCASILLKDSIHSSWSCFRENNGSSGKRVPPIFFTRRREDAKKEKQKNSGRERGVPGQFARANM